MIARRIIPKFLSVTENVSRGMTVAGLAHGAALGVLIVAAPQLFDRDLDRFASPISIQIFEGVYQQPEPQNVLRIEPDLPAAISVETAIESSDPDPPEGAVPRPENAPEIALPDVRPAAIEAARRAPRPADAGAAPEPAAPGDVALIYERGAPLTPDEERGQRETPDASRLQDRERLPENARAIEAEIRRLEAMKAQAVVEQKLAAARKQEAAARNAEERLAAMQRRLERLQIARAEARVPRIEPPDRAAPEAPREVAQDARTRATLTPDAAMPEKAAEVLERSERREKQDDALTPAERERARQAVERYRKAAQEGIPAAEMNLARALDRGDGVEKDRAKARSIMEDLAEKGYEPAQIELAKKHLTGDGVEESRKKAYILLKNAAEEDNVVARRALRALRDEMSLEERQQAEREAANRRRKIEQQHAEKRLPPARQKALDENLREAVDHGNIGKMETLLRAGADPNAIDASGRDAIIAAAWRGREMVVEFLIEKGVDIDTVDLDGRTPLAWAAINGYVHIVEDLLAHGADPNARDDTGTTPLIRAAWNGHFEVAETLLNGGANPLIEDRQGKTALDRAQEESWPRVVRLLEGRISAN
ncbi:ankyrin repeat domain-containing protein [Minwuia thermotolerans]|uniref:Uncharacterized protein n=1 Tax=Minwuia thermotolerans TaxID=2056226 RepID=A0A2M9G1B9_9PROT|nr:ankyrin repeat domain-containing protein [Minwuia thermotolerans]PJK29510.1 hypothetical protein CVT23_10635 [Minwuia thermotolerans]